MVMGHKIHIYLEYLSVCPLVGMGPPTPSPAIECVIPHVTNLGIHTRLRARGWESPNSDDWKKA
jgi:hypothetical protein